MFPDDTVSADRLLLGSRVILCTLSMLSNSKLSRFTLLVPIELVLVDEASQIEIGDYLPMLSRFSKTLRKLVFIGDDKQCSYLCFNCPTLVITALLVAPFGQDDVTELRSVFEMPHLRDRAIFLDTQCMLVQTLLYSMMGLIYETHEPQIECQCPLEISFLNTYTTGN